MTLSFEDRFELRQLAEVYGLAVDALDVDRFASLWTVDAVLALHDAAGEVRRWEGDEIPGMVRGVRRYLRTFHLVGNHEAREHGGAVTGTTYCVAHHLQRAEPATGGATAEGAVQDRVLAIRYDDRYARAGSEGGGWRFSRRDVRVLWRTRQPVDELGVAQ